MVPGLNPVQSPPSVYHNSLKSKGRVRAPPINGVLKQKARQKWSRLFEGQNLFNTLPRYLFCLGLGIRSFDFQANRSFFVQE